MQQAVFVIAEVSSNLFAATTRAADRGEIGKIGFPGGKVDSGETLTEAAIREAAEEGWLVEVADVDPIHQTEFDGFQIFWFRGSNPRMLVDYKESHRIQAITATEEEIIASGFGNDQAIKKYFGS